MSHPNNVSLNPAHIFGHVRRSMCDLVSTVSVKELCLKNRDALSAAITIHGAWQPYELKKDDGTDVYIQWAAWYLAVLDKNCGAHDGDCIKCACSCSLCLCESLYVEGVTELSYFENLLRLQTPDVQQRLSQFNNQCVLFMTICQLQEKYWRDREEIGECPEYVECFNQFLEMSVDEQKERYNRMLKVREYLQNPTPIKGIPWW